MREVEVCGGWRCGGRGGGECGVREVEVCERGGGVWEVEVCGEVEVCERGREVRW